MKVLYVSKALTVASYRDKLRALAERVEVVGVVPERWGGALPEAGDEHSHPVERWPVLFNGRNHLHLYRRPAALLDRFQPDLLHVDEEPYSAVTFQLARVCTRAGVPWLFFAWQNLDKWIPPPFSAIRHAVFRSAAGAIAGTESAAETLRRNGCRVPLEVIPQFGVDTARFAPDTEARSTARSRLGVAGDEVLVGFGGRLVPEKGLDVLLEAVTRCSSLRLVILGSGPDLGRLRGRAEALDAGDRIEFKGAVPSLEMPFWLNAMDILVLPSLSIPSWEEQFGRILVEAMACGVPVVASDSGEMPDVVGGDGLVVPEGDVGALAEALGRLAEDHALRRRLGSAGRSRALGQFSQDAVAECTVAFYERVLSMAAA